MNNSYNLKKEKKKYTFFYACTIQCTMIFYSSFFLEGEKTRERINNGGENARSSVSSPDNLFIIMCDCFIIFILIFFNQPLPRIQTKIPKTLKTTIDNCIKTLFSNTKYPFIITHTHTRAFITAYLYKRFLSHY